MRAKVKANRYKPEARHADKPGLFDAGAIDFCLKWILSVAFVSVLSLAVIFGYDLITQSSFFRVKQIHISGNRRVPDQKILTIAHLDTRPNVFRLNLHTLENQITSHPWIQSASVKRNLSSHLTIRIVEHQPLAIVKIENIASILINTQGYPFKEYNPSTDRLESLPVITGLDLTKTQSQYIFDGPLFNSTMNFLQQPFTMKRLRIDADSQTGLTIRTPDISDLIPAAADAAVPIKLGFSDFATKLKKAKTIGGYIEKKFPDRRIAAMDLFNLKKIFVKTTYDDTGHEIPEKGV